MKQFRISLCRFAFVAIAMFGTAAAAASQDRPRVVAPISSRPVSQSLGPSETRPENITPAPARVASRPVLTDRLVVASPPTEPQVKRTASSSAVSRMAMIARGKTVYTYSISAAILRGIEQRLGIPYLYGSSGPNRYDCSGLVWSVFRDAGIEFQRASARTLWAASIPVTGDERFKFGTLVFMNGLGHMGIVADENGFFHASSSKGVTYSPFAGYWEKRIVGFRRLVDRPDAEDIDAEPAELDKR